MDHRGPAGVRRLSHGMLGGSSDNRGLFGRGLLVVQRSFAFGHLTVDVSLLALGLGSRAIRPFVGAVQSLAFPLGGRALATVGEPFSFVCRLLPIIGKSLPRVSDAFSSGSLPLASFDLGLTPHNRLLARVKRGSLHFGRTGCIATVLSDHNSP
jgi:hypothetical protein